MSKLDDILALERDAELPAFTGCVPTWDADGFTLAWLPGRVLVRLDPDDPLTPTRANELTALGHPFVVGDAVQFTLAIAQELH